MSFLLFLGFLFCIGLFNEIRKPLPVPRIPKGKWRRGLTTDNNVVYIWKSGLLNQDCYPVYKVGITSARHGLRRINSLAEKYETQAEIIRYCVVKDAFSIEQRFLRYITKDHGLVGDGSSEMFTVNSENELNKLLLRFDKMVGRQTKPRPSKKNSLNNDFDESLPF